MSAHILLNDLNDKQKEAVVNTGSSLLVVAGAGSGKTKVLTTKIAWLIKHHYLGLSEILAVTFTNKAAKEMTNRVALALNIDVHSMWIGTFHSLALRLLTRHKQEANISTYFQVIDSQEQLSCIKRVIRILNLDEDRYIPKDLQRYINNNKENGVRASELFGQKFREQNWINIYTHYEELCNKSGLLDFSELLLRTCELFENNVEVRTMYQEQFKYILVDEFQDTNNIQYKWLKLLTGAHSKVFAVGDDDQSIYSFRGAKVSNMQAFLRDFACSETIRLEQNYRSTTKILDAANSLINNNGQRIGKSLWTENKSGEGIRLYEGYTEEDEAYFVADEIKNLFDSGVNLSQIAILYRSNAQSRIFEQHFYTQHIPYRVYGSLRFFERQEIKHVLAYLRLILNPDDNEAFLRVVNCPARGIGTKTIEKLQELATEKKKSLFSAVYDADVKPIDKVKPFNTLIKELQDVVKGLGLSEVISYVIDKTGLIEHYRKEKVGGNERIENLNELISSVVDYVNDGDTMQLLSSFLSFSILESGEHEASKIADAVQLMTVHAAKGLEFDTVFIVGLEDGLFPHENSLVNEKSVEEERRLMYVAITRARKRLYFARACSRLMWGHRQAAPLSRFINEIPNDLIINLTSISKVGYNSLADYVDEKSSDNDFTGKDYHSEFLNNNCSQDGGNEIKCKTTYINIEEKSLRIKLGDIISHAKFGNGKIIGLNSKGKKNIAEILFVGFGKKTLDLSIAKIEKVK